MDGPANQGLYRAGRLADLPIARVGSVENILRYESAYRFRSAAFGLGIDEWEFMRTR
jgi:hypothetical protein